MYGVLVLVPMDILRILYITVNSTSMILIRYSLRVPDASFDRVYLPICLDRASRRTVGSTMPVFAWSKVGQTFLLVWHDSKGSTKQRTERSPASDSNSHRYFTLLKSLVRIWR